MKIFKVSILVYSLLGNVPLFADISDSDLQAQIDKTKSDQKWVEKRCKDMPTDEAKKKNCTPCKNGTSYSKTGRLAQQRRPICGD